MSKKTNMCKRPKKKTAPAKHIATQPGAAVGWVMLIYFFSGACSLMDEVVWVRLLKLTLGNTVFASSVVISVFMGGLALGALIMGRYADRVKGRLRLYALLEVLVTISALCLPWVLRLVDGIYRWFFVTFSPAPWALMVVQVVLSSAILLVPAMLMGSTLPLLGRYVTMQRDRVGRLVGRLYALNMLGATLGCFLAGFVLIRSVGVMGTLYVAAGLNLFVALGGWILSRRRDPADRAETPAPGRAEAAREAGDAQRSPRRVLLAAFFISGMVSIGYEIIWMRSSSFLLGGFTYVFSSVLTVYLLGNVLGAWIGSRLSRRLKRPGVGFGVSLVCLGAMGVGYLPWFAAWFLKIEPAVSPMLDQTLGAASIRNAAMPLLHSTCLFFLPAVAMGVGFPLALQAWGNLRHDVGRTTGTVYGANTVGAVLGGAVTGFILIPMMGVQLAITLLGLAAVWLGWAMVRVFAPKGGTTLRKVNWAAAGALTVAAVAIPGTLFTRDIVGIGPGEIISVREGVTTTVAVKRKPDGHLVMTIDNVPIAGDDIHRSAQKTLGHLGVLLHDNAKSVLSVGFGCGETTACLVRHGVDRIDCVEIAPEVVETALAHFGHINLGPRLENHVNMMYMDAKNYLKLTDRRYDIIINGSDVHSTAASAPLFTKEHFSNALEHLNTGGLFITKLHLQGHPKSNFDSILATFLDVFPHTTVWFPVNKPFIFFYLVGSGQQQVFSLKHIDVELKKDRVRQSTAYLNFNSSMDVLNCYIADESDIKRYLNLEQQKVNSDYEPYIEFNLDTKKLVLGEYFTSLVTLLRQGSIAAHIDWAGLSADQQAKWQRGYALLDQAASFVFAAHATKAFMSQLRYTHIGLQIVPRHTALLEIRDRCLSNVRRALATGAVSAERVAADMSRLLSKRPKMGTAALVRSWALQRGADKAAALQAAARATRDAPDVAAVQTNLAVMQLAHGQAERAIGLHERAMRMDPDSVYTLDRFAWCLATCPQEAIRNGAKAITLAEKACKATGRSDPAIMDTLAAAYAEAGKFAEAVDAATKAVNLAEPRNKALAAKIRQRLALYKTGKPYRSGP